MKKNRLSKINYRVPLFFLVFILFFINSGCTIVVNTQNPTLAPSPTAPAEKTPGEATTPASAASPSSPEKTPETSVPIINEAAPKYVYEKFFLPYESPAISPRLPEYSAAPGLSNIENIDQFPDLSPGQIKILEENLFVVVPSDRQQLSYIYEENEYRYIPSFITTDSVLHLYHIFFDGTLTSVELHYLYGLCVEISSNMLNELKNLSKATSDPIIQQAIKICKTYFAVAETLLGAGASLSGAGYSGIDKNIYDRELALIESHEGFIESPLTGMNVFYDNFLPRGHYTKNETLTRYFMAMMWYGTMFFPLSPETGNDGYINAMVLAYALFSLPESDGIKIWESIYEPTGFFVGQSDDLTPYDIWNAMNDIGGVSLEKLSDPAFIETFSIQIRGYDKARVINKNSEDGESAYTDLQFRFMGQRYVPDSEILQRLSEPIKRPVPSGLDLAAVLGAQNAEKYVREHLKPELPHEFGSGWPDYYEKYEIAKRDFGILSPETWMSNMYYGWLWTIKSSFMELAQGMPSFMNSEAWRDKQLATGLGSWAELRHDTLLYVKQSGAEKGGWFEVLPKGYVEPNVELFYRLKWLTDYSAKSLSERGLISKYRADLCEDIIEMLDRLIEISLKELRGEVLSEDDYAYIMYFGGTLEWLMLKSVPEDDEFADILSERNMAVIADIHNTTFGFLHAAVGLANEIYVVVPAEGKLCLTRGAVFDYYELFLDTKHTDEMWKKWLADSSDKPERPFWTKSFISD